MTRLRGVIWLVAGAVLALLAGIVAFSALNRVAEQAAVDQGVLEPRVTVAVAGRDVPVRSVLTLEDLQVAEIPASTVPANALNSVDDAIGRLTTVDLVAGEPLLAQRLIDPNVVASDGRTAVYLVDGQLLLALPAQDLLSRVGVIKPGDNVDIAATLSFPSDRGIGAAEGGTTSRPPSSSCRMCRWSAPPGGWRRPRMWPRAQQPWQTNARTRCW